MKQRPARNLGFCHGAREAWSLFSGTEVVEIGVDLVVIEGYMTFM